MKKRKITFVFINVGRNKARWIKEIKCYIDKETIENEIIKEAKTVLMSQEVSVSEYENNKFKIFAGFHMVGSAEII